MTFGEKANPYAQLKRTVVADWAWSFPTYQFSIDRPKKDIKQIIIDPTEMMADVTKENNIFIQE
jgi:hypothetical protein